LTSLIAELPISEGGLPYIVAIYKFHKQKYRWISTAFSSIYINVAILLTISSMTLLEEVKEWTHTTIKGYKNFLRVETPIYWIIDSTTDFTLNTPDIINNIYVANITRCFESILISGNDTLYDAMESITRLDMSNMRNKQPRSKQLFWVRINDKGVTTKVIWASTCPKYGDWFLISVTIF
jgi:hypothetical protein